MTPAGMSNEDHARDKALETELEKVEAREKAKHPNKPWHPLIGQDFDEANEEASHAPSVHD